MTDVRLPGVLVLKLLRVEIAERGMQCKVGAPVFEACAKIQSETWTLIQSDWTPSDDR
jgi:hypothetical protein